MLAYIRWPPGVGILSTMSVRSLRSDLECMGPGGSTRRLHHQPTEPGFMARSFLDNPFGEGLTPP